MGLKWYSKSRRRSVVCKEMASIDALVSRWREQTKQTQVVRGGSVWPKTLSQVRRTAATPGEAEY